MNMGITANLGAFAGGLAGGYNQAENDKSRREYVGAETDALTKKTAAAQDIIAGKKEFAAKLKAWREGGMQGPAQIAAVGDASSGTIPSAAAPSTAAPAGSAVPAARMKVAQFLKAGGFDRLASGVASGRTVPDLPQPAAASPDVGLTTAASPYATAPVPGPAAGLSDDE